MNPEDEVLKDDEIFQGKRMLWDDRFEKNCEIMRRKFRVGPRHPDLMREAFDCEEVYDGEWDDE